MGYRYVQEARAGGNASVREGRAQGEGKKEAWVGRSRLAALRVRDGGGGAGGGNLATAAWRGANCSAPTRKRWHHLTLTRRLAVARRSRPTQLRTTLRTGTSCANCAGGARSRRAFQGGAAASLHLTPRPKTARSGRRGALQAALVHGCRWSVWKQRQRQRGLLGI